jgi:hypothetical protein
MVWKCCIYRQMLPGRYGAGKFAIINSIVMLSAAKHLLRRTGNAGSTLPDLHDRYFAALNMTSVDYRLIELIKAPEIHRYQLAHTRLLHGNAVDHIYRGHCLLVVRYNDELRIV